MRSVTTYSLPNAARILKVAPSRLRYWKRTRLTVPLADLHRGAPATAADSLSELEEVAVAEPSASDYEFRDLVGIRAVLSLLDRGISLRRIRRSIEFLRDTVPEIEDPLSALRLLGEGSGRVVVEHDGQLIEPDGQVLFAFAREEREEAGAAGVASIDGGRSSAEASPLAQSAGEWFERGCQLDSEPATHAEAVAAYRKAVGLAPDFADAHCNLGALFYNNGDRSEARRCFERCLRLQPGHVEAHFNLANLLEQEGCDEMGLHHFRAALEADPFYPDLHINLALLCEKLSLTVKALEHWKRYLQLDPEGSWSDVARLRLAE
jgi:tetratricopeptide (TPR) repeat protein